MAPQGDYDYQEADEELGDPMGDDLSDPEMGIPEDEGPDGDGGEEMRSPHATYADLKPQARFWKQGDQLHGVVQGYKEDGELVRVGASVSLAHVKRVVLKRLSDKGFGKMAPLFADRIASYLATKKLKDKVSGDYQAACRLRPVDYIMGQDYAKDAMAAVPIALDVISLFYPVAGASMKLVDSAQSGNKESKQEIVNTANKANQGDVQAQATLLQLQKAVEELKRLKQVVGSNPDAKPTPQREEIQVSHGLYERGLGK